jgi:hypothetical protein
VSQPFASSDLFRCPNGLAFDGAGNLYTVNFRNNRMFKIDRQGGVSLFTTVSERGLGHLCFAADRFYVTAYESHELFQVRWMAKPSAFWVAASAVWSMVRMELRGCRSRTA